MVYDYTVSNQKSQNSNSGLIDPKVLEICLYISWPYVIISVLGANISGVYKELGPVLYFYKDYLIYSHNSHTIGDIIMPDFVDEDAALPQGHTERNQQS